MSNGSKRKPSLDFDVGLGLKMPTDQSRPPGDVINGPIFGGNYMSNIYHPASSYASRNFLSTGYAAGGGMAVSGKALFTATQWEELERQNLIHKYIMASIPVPAQLLFPFSITQSNTTPGMELKYSTSSYGGGGGGEEPWRCKRTDGKKWRCSRDVAPDQKYCERHAHKNRPRSRKHVETSITTATTPLPTMASSTTTYDQTYRCMEWLMKSDQQQWQQNSSRLVNKDTSDHNKNVSVSYDDKLQALIGPYIPDTSNLHKTETFSTLDSNAADKTRRFIDAWDNEGKKFYPSSSLTLSMSNGLDHHDSESSYLGNIGMRGNDGIMKFGGPLGEALCLGNGTMTRGNSGNSSLLASPGDHGYSNTNSSSCSKGSCEDGNNGLNFIG